MRRVKQAREKKTRAITGEHEAAKGEPDGKD